MSAPNAQNPDVSPAGTADTNPALATGVKMLAGWAVVALAGYFGLPLGDNTKLIVGLVAAGLMPLAQAAWTRLQVWSPATVARLQADWQALVHETATANPPAVTNAPMTAVQASEAHPGVLGHSGPGDPATDTLPESLRGRHGGGSRSTRR